MLAVTGFVFTQTKDRLWRKNRQVNAGKGRSASCVGRDLNRNWASAWGKAGGASDKPCRSTFRGFRPLDAPETRALAVELEAIREEQGIRLFIDWHAFGQLVMHRASLLTADLFRFFPAIITEED